jgi:acid stress chaperone HdeB
MAADFRYVVTATSRRISIPNFLSTVYDPAGSFIILPMEWSTKAMNRLRMNLSLGCLILFGVTAPATSQAQIAVNMSLLTCGQYLAMSPDQSRIYAAWMSGWFNQKMGTTYVNLEAYERNVENVKAWCGTNPNELVMTGLERATGK